MKKLIAVIALAFAAIASTSVAHAEPMYKGPRYHGSFGDHDPHAMRLDVSEYVSSDVTTEQIERLAVLICYHLVVDNWSEMKIVLEIVGDTDASIPKMGSIVHAAEYHYCPTEFG